MENAFFGAAILFLVIYAAHFVMRILEVKKRELENQKRERIDQAVTVGWRAVTRREELDYDNKKFFEEELPLELQIRHRRLQIQCEIARSEEELKNYSELFDEVAKKNAPAEGTKITVFQECKCKGEGDCCSGSDYDLDPYH